MSGPLDGVRVIELASVVLGPWACQVLGDLGADVVKVEPPAGDSNRRVGPARSPLMGALFLACNRNKRSVVLDAKQPLGREALLRLIAGADVLVHNLRPASLARLGLQYRALAALNPRLIFCGTYGYGARGPYADRPAYDDSVQAASGVAGLAERLGGEPAFVPTIMADKTTALAVVGAVTAALYARERTGQGQEVEVPMFETMVAYLMVEHLYGATFDPPAGRPGYTRLLTPRRRPHRTLDGCLAVLPYLDDHWQAFCDVAGRPDLAADPRFATLAARAEHIDEVYAETGRIVATRTTAEWLDRLGAAGVPVTAVRSLDDLLADEHLLATGFWQFLEATSEGRLRMPGVPMRFEATPGTIRRAPPRLGEHSAEVLREAGLSAEEIEALARGGVTVAAGMEEW
jgi:crotonobetainyl-CoA:carnitine CoA-transferase CaiB-like acyl-CoA transferase